MEGRTLGLDVGERWIGVALSDPLGILASPLTRIERTDDEAAVKSIADLVRKHEAKAVVGERPNWGKAVARTRRSWRRP